MGLFDKLKQGLEKTKQILRTDVRDLLKAGEIFDEEKLERFEAALIRTDMGVAAATQIVDELRQQHGGRTVVVDEIWETVRHKLKQILKGDEGTGWDADNPLGPIRRAEQGTTVILVAGVNGSGKTTSIAKLAKLIQDAGHSVVLAAGDTFRAAAVEQLGKWAQRIGCEIVTQPSGSDPASVAHIACQRALEIDAGFVIIDTAGRLQTQRNLMDELGKIYRVAGNKIPGAPHESLLVLDATTGQNGISQAKSFSDAVKCTGIVLAKLDGSAKGGVVVPIRLQMGMPVKYVGLGEKLDDLEAFDADRFVDAFLEE